MKEENYLLVELKNGNKVAFTLIFHQYYRDLVIFAGNYLQNKERCENIVQSIFLKLWSDREILVIEISLKSFLLKSVKNACLDEIRHKQVVRDHENYSINIPDIEDSLDTENYILYSDLQFHLAKALDKLPRTYKEAFEMNRFDGLKYKEIALQLNVSERTIEVRVSKALGLLRKYLKEFFISILLLLIS